MRKRKHLKQIWLSDEEFMIMNKNAEISGMNVSDYMRYLILGYKPKEKPPKEFYDSIKEIRRIGKNINQIARLASASNKIDQINYYKQINMLNNIVIEMKRKYLKPEKQ